MPVENAPLPRAETFATATLALDHGHTLYYEESGARDGIPVIVLHGGPGSSSTLRHREFFDGRVWRIIQFDQRGCGKSAPAGATAHNHTAALIADIELLRTHLGIARWCVFGGSWGASLALAYAARHGDATSALVLRGTYLTGDADNHWFFHGAAALRPEAHAAFLAQVPQRWRRSMETWLDRVFQSADVEKKSRVAAAWQRYEETLNDPYAMQVAAAASVVDSAALCAKYTILAHYLARRCFLGDAMLMRAAASLRGIPVAIVHGTLDFICRPANALRVHRAIAGSCLAWAAGAGHDPFQAATKSLLIQATRCFAEHGDFARWPTHAPT